MGSRSIVYPRRLGFSPLVSIVHVVVRCLLVCASGSDAFGLDTTPLALLINLLVGCQLRAGEGVPDQWIYY